jgi:predicted RNase H-like HicB family nuclease
MQRKQLTYRIILTQEPEGGYTLNIPALPGCITYGNNINYAIEMAKEAIEEYLEVLEDLNKKARTKLSRLSNHLTN